MASQSGSESSTMSSQIEANSPDDAADISEKQQKANIKLVVSCRLAPTDQGRITAIEHSATALINQLFLPKETHRSTEGFQEAIWPELGQPEFQSEMVKKITLTLWPLSRIGQMEGRSGSQVLIAYFSASNLSDCHSRPLIIKTLDKRKSDKLGIEYNNALSVECFVNDRKDGFAMPIFFEPDQVGYQILWSICSVSSPIKTEQGSGELVFFVDDLRTPLKRGSHSRAGKVISAALELLSSFHRRAGSETASSLEIKQEYKVYLREMWPEDSSKWGEKWEAVWASREEQYLPNDRTKYNPLWIIDKLLDMKIDMHLGAIHGDLHPGNIILGEKDAPTIIDFGWACDKSHIAKDFVLLECNLRFLTLQTELPEQEIEAFAKWIGWNASQPSVGKYLNARMKLIQDVRNKAAAVFPQGTDWDREYIAPLLLVAVGLLRFAPQLGNQLAAIRFVESAACYLARQFGW